MLISKLRKHADFAEATAVVEKHNLPLTVYFDLLVDLNMCEEYIEIQGTGPDYHIYIH